MKRTVFIAVPLLLTLSIIAACMSAATDDGHVESRVLGVVPIADQPPAEANPGEIAPWDNGQWNDLDNTSKLGRIEEWNEAHGGAPEAQPTAVSRGILDVVGGFVPGLKGLVGTTVLGVAVRMAAKRSRRDMIAATKSTAGAFLALIGRLMPATSRLGGWLDVKAAKLNGNFVDAIIKGLSSFGLTHTNPDPVTAISSLACKVMEDGSIDGNVTLSELAQSKLRARA